MATIAATSMSGVGARALTQTTMTASDTFTYAAGSEPILILRNPTAGALSPVIDGDGAPTVDVKGAGRFDLSAGYAVGSIASGAMVAIPLGTISKYLAGTIAVTGGTGLVAVLLA